MGLLVAYGHSWVGGAGASAPDLGFVAVAARRLDLTADNRGVGGSESPDTAERVRAAPPPAADLFVVMTGLNDARRHGIAAEALLAYETALATIFTQLMDASPGTPTIAVVQPLLLDYSLHEPHDRGSDESIEAYNERLRSVAHRFPDVVLAPVLAWDAASMLAEDTVHPNDDGHARVATSVVRAASV